jgi:hypothetical protein
MCAPRDMRGKTVSMLCVNRYSSGIWSVPGRAFVVCERYRTREEAAWASSTFLVVFSGLATCSRAAALSCLFCCFAASPIAFSSSSSGLLPFPFFSVSGVPSLSAAACSSSSSFSFFSASSLATCPRAAAAREAWSSSSSLAAATARLFLSSQ